MALEIQEIAIQMQVSDTANRPESSSPAAPAVSACGEPEDTVERAVRSVLKALKAKRER